MHHLLFIQLLNEKTEAAYRQVYEAYAKRLYSFIFPIVENKAKAEEIINATFTTLWDEPPVLSLQRPDPFLFLLQKSIRHLLIHEQAHQKNIREHAPSRVKSLHREPHLKVVVSHASSHSRITEELAPRPSA